jgi:hypothetical protein
MIGKYGDCEDKFFNKKNRLTALFGDRIYVIPLCP